MNKRFDMMLPRRSTILGGAALAAGSTMPARAQLTIDMTRPTFEPVPIAIVDFAGDRVGADIAGVVRNDLQNSGLFRSIQPSAFIQQNLDANAAPRFADWRGIGAAGVVVGQVQQVGGNIKVDFRLWDVVVGQQATGLSFTSQPANWRRLAHIIADAIYKRVSPTLQEIVYMAYAEDRSPPRVYLQNVDSGRRELLGNFPGMSFAPRFSPDGTKVVMSISTDGNTDIYEMDVRGRALRRLTNTPAIDTSPCYSNNGTQIVFNSDRGGTQQLYVMSAGGGGERRISFGEGRYATPVWSPRGDYVAFTKISGGSFGIGVMRPDGGGERMLASGFLVEGPTWAPNGRVLMFFRQARGAGVSLHQVDITGRFERQVPTPTDASDPAWSPLIPQ